MLGLNPYLIIGVIVILIGSHGAAYYYGGDNRENAIKADQLIATNKAIKSAIEQAKEDSKLAATEIKIQEKIKVKYRYIRDKTNENIYKNVSYAECGLDDGGLRIYNSSAANPEGNPTKPAH